MCTVGYGDISPTNPLEIGLNIINILFACLVFAHAVRYFFLLNKIFFF
jgi:hypothetical protein